MPGLGNRLESSTTLIISTKNSYALSIYVKVPFIRENSYLEHNFPVGLAFIL